MSGNVGTSSMDGGQGSIGLVIGLEKAGNIGPWRLRGDFGQDLFAGKIGFPTKLGPQFGDQGQALFAISQNKKIDKGS